LVPGEYGASGGAEPFGTITLYGTERTPFDSDAVVGMNRLD